MTDREPDIPSAAASRIDVGLSLAGLWAKLADSRPSDALVRFAFPVYALFIFGFFIAPKMPEHYEYFYWTQLPVALLLVPRAYGLVQQSLLFRLVLAYIGYMAASSLWSESVGAGEILFGMRLALYVLAFVVVTFVLLHEVPQRFEAMLKMTCALAAVTAVAAVVVFYAEHPFPTERLHGIGRMQFIIRTGYIFGLFAVLAFYYWVQESRPLLRAAYGAMIVVLLVAVILTQSRATAVAIFLAAVIVAFSKRPKWALTVAAGLALLAAGVWALRDAATGFFVGLPYRPEIWLHYLSHTWDTAPLFGHGLVTQWPLISKALPYWEAHNAFVGTFRDGGAAGLVLLVSVVFYAFVVAVKLIRAQPDYAYRCLAMMSYLLVCILSNDDRLLIRPQELWLYFWLPLVLVMVGEVRAYDSVASADSA
jgi:hypothetical protein